MSYYNVRDKLTIEEDDELLEKDYYQCDCGSIIKFNSQYSHEKTRKHKELGGHIGVIMLSSDDDDWLDN